MAHPGACAPLSPGARASHRRTRRAPTSASCGMITRSGTERRKRMIKLFVFLGLSMIALAPSPAIAQTAGMTRHFFECLNTRQRQDVRTLLSTSDAEIARHAYEHLAKSSRCFNESVGDRQYAP